MMRRPILLLTVSAALSGSTLALPSASDHAERVGFTVGSDRWLFQVKSRPGPSRTLYDLHVLKNGRRVLRRPRTQPEWVMSFAVRRMAFKSSFPIVAAMSYPGAGHPDLTTFFGIRGGSLITMGSVEAENGGPLFRDYDCDGRSEWVFDDYKWSRYYTRGPRYLQIYKQDSGDVSNSGSAFQTRPGRRFRIEFGSSARIAGSVEDAPFPARPT